ncbi:MAG TPA: protein phosphatase 2C domain-containing protein [Rhodanobacteraceae bacterium]|nr:protein phosphatase 2C domain-containing protein [Rhodanobacteraceae bacterium]
MIEFGHGTHVGLRREHNEDTYHADPSAGLWLVADGMGGHAHGEVASAIARDTVPARLAEGRGLGDAIRDADRAIISVSSRRDGMLPMGTTIAALRLAGGQYDVAWVGDSRVYLLDQDGFRQLSQDHSYVQELVAQGAISEAEARHHPRRNVVTQALGVTAPDDLQISELHGDALPGMQFLLCSDGLTEEVDNHAIAALLQRRELSAQECVDSLILAALEGGGSDNITVLLVRIT